MEEQQYDVIVIGGGISGLAAAALLAKKGKRVTLLEQSKSLGGRAKTRVVDGFHFNLGAHALYRSGPAEAVLHELGVQYKGTAPPLTGQLAVNGGSLHTFPTGTMSLLTTDLFGLSAKLEAARFLTSIGRLGTADVMSLTLGEWLDDRVTRSEVRDLLLAVFRLTTYTNAEDVISAGSCITQLQRALSHGVIYLDHGWQTLIDGLAKVAEQNGVTIGTGVKVDSIKFAPGAGVRGVRLSTGDLLTAASVLIASSPSVAAGLLGNYSGRRPLWEKESIPVKAASMDVALRKLPRPRSTFALGIDKPLYFSVHSASAQLAPEGAALLHMIWYLPPEANEAPEQIKREFHNLLDLMQPGWRDFLVHSEFLPDLVVANRLPEARTGGSAGWPAPAVPDVPGLFIAGDWVRGEGLLADAALASASAAASVILSSSARAAVAV